mmetsp:Transcript_6128/g.10905  ORF Transcript_6128/g.10905 Transcript_6128/m.10905 type:complete len:139 (+) Transcript_6128:500-916(+)
MKILGAGCMYGAIVGHNGAKWASSTGFALGTAEAERLAVKLGAENYKDLKSIYEKGVYVCGQQYSVCIVELVDEHGWPPFLLGSCKEKGKSKQKLLVIWTEKALCVGVFDEKYSKGKSIQNARVQLGKLADFMISSGY